MFVGSGIDQLYIYPHSIAGSLHAAFEDSCDAKLLTNGFHVLGGVLVFEHRCARNHFQ